MKQLKALTLVFILTFIPAGRMVHAQPRASDADNTAKLKADVAKRIAGKKTHVNIELRNGDKLKGRIEQTDDSKFTIRQDKTGKIIDLSYSDVLTVKGQGLGTGAKIGIAVGIAVVVLAVAVVVALKNFDPFEGGITAR